MCTGQRTVGSLFLPCGAGELTQVMWFSSKGFLPAGPSHQLSPHPVTRLALNVLNCPNKLEITDTV